MSPNRYTELFFLDEAVAFAAGHRPCAECRRERYNGFKVAWQRVHGDDKLPFADEMDLELHPTRIANGKKVTHEAALNSLPDGCFVQIDGWAYLVANEALLLWTPEGYARRDERLKDSIMTVLTSESIVGCFRQGYRAEIHESGRALLNKD
jgi:hypothetical protein